nr:hypothetical protein [Streptomyces sp. NRRL F-2580]
MAGWARGERFSHRGDVPDSPGWSDEQKETVDRMRAELLKLSTAVVDHLYWETVPPAYDAVTLRGATHVWAFHNTFTDGPHFDASNPRCFGREYQVHDGALGITNTSDLVTAWYNRFNDHDRTMLIGSSDKDTKLRVTLHHNVFQSIVQRAPLARVGQVHLYNNHFDTAARNGYTHSYSVNARAGVQVVAQNNCWTLSSDRKASQLLSGDGTGAVAGSGNMVNGSVTDLVAAYNAANKKKIKPETNWRPTLSRGLESSAAGLPASLARSAGEGVLK